MTTFRLFLLSSALFGTAAMAQNMTISAPIVSGTLASGIVIAAAPQHAQGPAAIAMMAVEITNGSATWSYPSLNDTGTAGDSVAGDGLWSVAADLPGATPGDYSVTLYLLDTSGVELVSAPQSVIVN